MYMFHKINWKESKIYVRLELNKYFFASSKVKNFISYVHNY